MTICLAKQKSSAGVHNNDVLYLVGFLTWLELPVGGASIFEYFQIIQKKIDSIVLIIVITKISVLSSFQICNFCLDMWYLRIWARYRLSLFSIGFLSLMEADPGQTYAFRSLKLKIREPGDVRVFYTNHFIHTLIILSKKLIKINVVNSCGFAWKAKRGLNNSSGSAVKIVCTLQTEQDWSWSGKNGRTVSL